MLINPWDATSIIVPHPAPPYARCAALEGKSAYTKNWAPLGSYGGESLTAAVKKNIVHMYYDLLLTPEEIAPLILSPRKALGGVGVRAVRDVLDFFEDVPRVHRAVKMPEAHIVMLIEIVKRTPWLYLDEISVCQEKPKRRPALYIA